jgi:hypothetical protein
MVDGPVPNFVSKGVLRPDLDPAEAANIRRLLAEPAAYNRLVNRCGRSQEVSRAHQPAAD